MIIRRGNTPVKNINKFDLVLTLFVFVVAPALAIWWLYDLIYRTVWWLLPPMYLAWLWHLFRHQKSNDDATYNEATETTSHVNPVPAATEFVTASVKHIDTRPWQERVADIEATRVGDAQPLPASSITGQSAFLAAGPRANTNKSLLPIIRRAAKIANIDQAPLVGARAEIQAALESGSSRSLSLVLRQCCPDPAWHWPEAHALLLAQGKRATRLQQVDLLANLITRAHMWAARRAQMLSCTDRRPWWQFRATGDGRDPGHCLMLNGRIERYDSKFWRKNAPWLCARAECRCTVRTLSASEIESR